MGEESRARADLPCQGQLSLPQGHPLSSQLRHRNPVLGHGGRGGRAAHGRGLGCCSPFCDTLACHPVSCHTLLGRGGSPLSVSGQWAGASILSSGEEHTSGREVGAVGREQETEPREG